MHLVRDLLTSVLNCVMSLQNVPSYKEIKGEDAPEQPDISG